MANNQNPNERNNPQTGNPQTGNPQQGNSGQQSGNLGQQDQQAPKDGQRDQQQKQHPQRGRYLSILSAAGCVPAASIVWRQKMKEAEGDGRAVKATHLRDDKNKPGTVPVGEIATVPGGNSPDSAMCEDRTRPGRINNSKDC